MRIYLVVLLSLLVPKAFSQAPAPTGVPSEPLPTPTPVPERLNFTVYVWPTTGILTEESEMPVIPRTFYDSPTGMQRVHLHRATKSSVYLYTGPSPLVLYDVERELIPPPEDAPPETPPTVSTTKIPILKVSFPSGARHVNLIAFPSQIQDDGTMLTFPMPQFDESLKPGEATLYNASDSSVIITDRQDGNPLVFRPYETKKLPEEWHGTAPDRIRVFRRDSSGALNLAAMTRIRSQEDRVNLFFLYPKKNHRMRILNVGSQMPESE